MLKFSRSRRPVGLKPDDFDHEISLVDHDGSETSISPGTPEPNDVSRSSTTARLLNTNDTGDESQTEDQGSERAEQSRGGRKQQDEQDTAQASNGEGQNGNKSTAQDKNQDGQPQISSKPSIEIQEPTPDCANRTQPQAKPGKPREKREVAIDVLYENQRGGFLCGLALFSEQALGGLDPSPWTNVFHKCSPTNIFTAQVPDPSWEWAWPEWRVNHEEGVDPDGWEYSFYFSKKFSWHGPRWWNSFVRRRAWIRKRVQMRTEDISADPHMLNTDYFNVQSASEQRSRSRDSRASFASKASGSQVSGLGAGEEQPDIEKVDNLLQSLRLARIDREKLDAVENYLEHATDLEKLQEAMHEIMSILIFQASRRILLSRLMRMYDETTEKTEKSDSTELQERKAALKEAVKHADEEVRKLAYWSDVKKMTQRGNNRDAVDSDKGWDDSWQGLDQSGGAYPRPLEQQAKNQTKKK